MRGRRPRPAGTCDRAAAPLCAERPSTDRAGCPPFPTLRWLRATLAPSAAERGGGSRRKQVPRTRVPDGARLVTAADAAVAAARESIGADGGFGHGGAHELGPPTAASCRSWDRTPTSGSGTEPAATMSKSRDQTAGAKSRKRVAKSASLEPSTCRPKTLAWTRPVEGNIEQAEAKDERWLRHPI